MLAILMDKTVVAVVVVGGDDGGGFATDRVEVTLHAVI